MIRLIKARYADEFHCGTNPTHKRSKGSVGSFACNLGQETNWWLPKKIVIFRFMFGGRNGWRLTFGDRFTQIQDQMRDHGPGCDFI